MSIFVALWWDKLPVHSWYDDFWRGVVTLHARGPLMINTQEEDECLLLFVLQETTQDVVKPVTFRVEADLNSNNGSLVASNQQALVNSFRR